MKARGPYGPDHAPFWIVRRHNGRREIVDGEGLVEFYRLHSPVMQVLAPWLRGILALREVTGD